MSSFAFSNLLLSSLAFSIISVASDIEKSSSFLAFFARDTYLSTYSLYVSSIESQFSLEELDELLSSESSELEVEKSSADELLASYELSLLSDEYELLSSAVSVAKEVSIPLSELDVFFEPQATRRMTANAIAESCNVFL